METSSSRVQRKKSCINCGAELTYAPGTDTITCDYCHYQETIERPQQPFEEKELQPYLDSIGNQAHSTQISMLTCNNCGAKQHIEENYKSLHCVYCTTPLILEEASVEEWIPPGAVVPFKIDQNKAHQIFKKWVHGLWWAPNNLQRATISPENTKGLYLPYWTFDAQLKATYAGKRGEYYYTTKTVGSGKNKRRVQERHTRWHAAHGTVEGFIDDTLIRASRQTGRRIPQQIAHWQLKELKNYDSRFLAGYVTEKYTVSLKDGHGGAQEKATDIAHNWARRDIGGDVQEIDTLDSSLKNETFKHILLPVYISSYNFNGKLFNFFINGQTSKIHGDRPYSFWKIFLAVAAAVIIGALILYFTSSVQ